MSESEWKLRKFKLLSGNSPPNRGTQRHELAEDPPHMEPLPPPPPPPPRGDIEYLEHIFFLSSSTPEGYQRAAADGESPEANQGEQGTATGQEAEQEVKDGSEGGDALGSLAFGFLASGFPQEQPTYKSVLESAGSKQKDRHSANLPKTESVRSTPTPQQKGVTPFNTKTLSEDPDVTPDPYDLGNVRNFERLYLTIPKAAECFSKTLQLLQTHLGITNEAILNARYDTTSAFEVNKKFLEWATKHIDILVCSRSYLKEVYQYNLCAWIDNKRTARIQNANRPRLRSTRQTMRASVKHALLVFPGHVELMQWGPSATEPVKLGGLSWVQDPAVKLLTSDRHIKLEWDNRIYDGPLKGALDMGVLIRLCEPFEGPKNPRRQTFERERWSWDRSERGGHGTGLTVEQWQALGVSKAGVDAVFQARQTLNVVEERIWGVVEESIGVVDGGVVDLVPERGGHGTGVGAGVAAAARAAGAAAARDAAGAGVVVSNDPLRRQIGDLRRDRPNRFSPY